jgi:hypothetical protein
MEFAVLDEKKSVVVTPYAGGGTAGDLGVDGAGTVSELRTKPSKDVVDQLLNIGSLVARMTHKGLHLALPQVFGYNLGMHVHTEVRESKGNLVCRLMGPALTSILHWWSDQGHRDATMSRASGEYGGLYGWRPQEWRVQHRFPEVQPADGTGKSCECELCSAAGMLRPRRGTVPAGPQDTIAAEFRAWPTGLLDPALSAYQFAMTRAAVCAVEGGGTIKAELKDCAPWLALATKQIRKSELADFRPRWKIRPLGGWGIPYKRDEISTTDFLRLNDQLEQPLHIVDCMDCAEFAKEQKLTPVVSLSDGNKCNANRKIPFSSLLKPKKLSEGIYRVNT